MTERTIQPLWLRSCLPVLAKCLWDVCWNVILFCSLLTLRKNLKRNVFHKPAERCSANCTDLRDKTKNRTYKVLFKPGGKAAWCLCEDAQSVCVSVIKSILLHKNHLNSKCNKSKIKKTCVKPRSLSSAKGQRFLMLSIKHYMVIFSTTQWQMLVEL